LIAAMSVSSLISATLFLYVFNSNQTEKNFELKNDKTSDSKFDWEENYSKVYVKTESGEIQGKRYDVLHTEVDVFLGIPYAEPPTGIPCIQVQSRSF